MALTTISEGKANTLESQLLRLNSDGGIHGLEEMLRDMRGRISLSEVRLVVVGMSGCKGLLTYGLSHAN